MAFPFIFVPWCLRESHPPSLNLETLKSVIRRPGEAEGC